MASETVTIQIVRDDGTVIDELQLQIDTVEEINLSSGGA